MTGDSVFHRGPGKGTRGALADQDSALRDLRRQLAQLRYHTDRVQAQLGFLLTQTMRRELEQVLDSQTFQTKGDETAMGVISSAAGVQEPVIWRLLAGKIRPTDHHRIQRLLALHPSKAATNLLRADKLMAELSALDDRQRTLEARALELRRNPGHQARAAHDAAAAKRAEAAAGKTAPGEAVAEQPDAPTAPAPSPPGETECRTTPPLPDLDGHENRPNPLLAQTEAEFVLMMKALRIWAGNPSLRQMEKDCGKQFSFSTFRNMLKASTLPAKVEMVEAFVWALCRSETEQQRWVTAWRNLMLSRNKKFTQVAPVSFSDVRNSWGRNFENFEDLNDIHDIENPEAERKIYRLSPTGGPEHLRGR